jgi:hypothetical protein
MSIKVGYNNILEDADSVTISVADASGYPAMRLYDRIFNKNWKSGSTGTRSLVGPDLVTNGGFTTDLSSWTASENVWTDVIAGGYSGNGVLIGHGMSTATNKVTNSDCASNITGWAADTPTEMHVSYDTSVGPDSAVGCARVGLYVDSTQLCQNNEFENITGGELDNWSEYQGNNIQNAGGNSGYCCELNINTGSNLVTNGEFETDTSGWTGNNATLARASGGYSGTYCMSVTRTGGTNQEAYALITGLVSGASYRATAWYKLSSGTATSIRIWGGDEDSRTTSLGYTSGTPDGTWRKIGVDLTVPSGDTGFYIRLYTAANAANVMLWDKVECYRIYSAQETYQKITGLTENRQYYISGYVKNNGASTPTYAYYVANGTSTPGSGWSIIYNSGNITSPGSWTAFAVTITLPVGQDSLYIVLRKTSNASASVTADSVLFDTIGCLKVQSYAYQDMYQSITGLTVGKTYRMIAYAKNGTNWGGGSVSSNFRLQVQVTGESSITSTAFTGQLTTTSSWQVAYVNFTPISHTTANIWCVKESSTYGYILFDYIYVEEYRETAVGYLQQGITTEVGAEYQLSAYVKDGNIAGASYAMKASDGTNVLNSTTGTTTSGTDWVAISFYFTATTTTSYVEIYKNDLWVYGNGVFSYPTRIGLLGYIIFDSVAVQKAETSYPAHTFIVDQGASGIDNCDTLVIPSGHNLNGTNVELEYSTDNVSYSDAVTNWTQTDANIIVKQASAVLNKRYWKLTISGFTSPTMLPQLPELFMTELKTLTAVPTYGLRKINKRFVYRDETPSGKVRFFYKGAPKRYYEYTLPAAKSDDKTILEALEDECGMVKPFYFEDHEGNKMMAELTEPINYVPIAKNNAGDVLYRIDLKIMESL